MRRAAWTLVLLTTVALVGVLGARSAGEQAPDFALRDAANRPVHLSDYRGKVVLLDFWATWCGGCNVELPWFVEFDQKYRSRGLAVIGVSMDDGWPVIKPFVAKMKMAYPVVLGNEATARTYRVDGLPVTLVIGRDGRILETHRDVVNRAALEATIRRLLNISNP